MRSSRSPFCPTASLSLQGHILAAQAIGDVYCFGKGVAIDYPRAMAAYKIAAEAGDADSQLILGMMYFNGHGVDVDYKLALPWFEKAAAQDQPLAVRVLGTMYADGLGAAPSWRRAREFYPRAIKLGDSRTVEGMQMLTLDIAEHAPLMDKRVEIHGTSRADINGKRGVATDFHWYEDKRKWRYTVQLDSGEAFKIKPANLRADRARGGAGDGKAKGSGKGKKARSGRS